MAKSNVKKRAISEEEYTTNKVLTVFSVCLLGVLVLMVVERLLDYVSTWAAGMVLVRVLIGVGAAGVLWAVWLLTREASGKRTAARRIICGRNVMIVSVMTVLCMSVIHYIGTQPIKMLYVILPVLAVYYLVYHSYAPEFFLIALDAGLAMGLMFVVHRTLDSVSFGWMPYAAVGAAVVLAVLQLVCVVRLRGQKGKFTFRGKKVDTQFSRNAYIMLMVTPLLMAALTLLVWAMPAQMAIAIGVAAAYLFITAVYYTVKLM